MRKAGIPLLLGTVMLIAAAAGFVIVPEHKPEVLGGSRSGGYLLGGLSVAVGWSRTLYDALRIASWACLIVGAVLVAVGLINYARR